MQALHGVFVCQDETQNRNQTHQTTNEATSQGDIQKPQGAHQHSTNTLLGTNSKSA